MDNRNLNDSKTIMEQIVKENLIPRYLYKYSNLATLRKIIVSGQIRFSKPSEFNDPFDCNISIDTENTEEEIIRYIDQITANSHLSATEYLQFRTKMLDPVARFELTNRSIRDAKESFGVTCFSTESNNILMWSHYAEKHKGVVIKFDILKDPDFFNTPFKVEYKSDFPNFNYLRNRESIGKLLLETKSMEWSYENEIRVMKRGAGYYPIKRESICQIIFGCRAYDKEIRKIIKYISKYKEMKPTFLHAKTNSNSFKIILSEL